MWGLLLPIRQAFDQYINLRPVRLLPGIPGPLRDKGPADIDFVCVRENTEGEYCGVGGRVHRGGDDEVAVQTAVFTRAGTERVLRYAFEVAARRPRHELVSATKSNALQYSMVFWDEVLAALQAEYPQIKCRQYHVDALVARFITAPESLDVVVGSNLFGDILTDLGGALQGSLGIPPSGNIDPTRRHPSLFEPVHGSAPDIAGKGIANPIAAHLGGFHDARSPGPRGRRQPAGASHRGRHRRWPHPDARPGRHGHHLPGGRDGARAAVQRLGA